MMLKTLRQTICLLWFIYNLASANLISRDTYTETLDIHQVQADQVAVKFTFTTKTPLIQELDSFEHYDLFPKVIADLMRKNQVNELSLSLTQGFWRNHHWPDIRLSRPSGAQISAWFMPATLRPDENWKYLILAISGLLCASFSQIDPKFTVVPLSDNKPQGIVFFADNKKLLNKTLAKYGVLPNENVCTENLTPWKKLLPCKVGFSQLLYPQKFFSTIYSTIGLDVRHSCGDEACSYLTIDLVQTAAVVFRSNRFKNGLSLYKLFPRFSLEQCHLSSSSKIQISVPTSMNPQILPDTFTSISSTNDQKVIRFNVDDLLTNKTGFQDFEIRYQKNNDLPRFSKKNIFLHTFLTGTGQQEGTVVSLIENFHNHSVRLLYSHVIPSYVRTFFHTLAITCNGQTIKADSVYYDPAQRPNKPHYFEIKLSMPSVSTCRISIDFEKSLLRWTEYPPDAHRGFHIPAPCLTYNNAVGNNDKKLTKICGEVVLVNLPTPDFSMPYNVICLVCTVMALAFGPLHNLTTKSLLLVSEEELKERSLMHKLKQFFTFSTTKIQLRPKTFIVSLIFYLFFIACLPVAFCYLSCDVYCRAWNIGFLCFDNV